MINIHPQTQQAYRLLHDGVLALSRAEQVGIRLDVEYVEKQKIHLTRRIDRMERQFKETKFFRHWEHSMSGKVNIYSNQQLSSFLYGVKKLTPEKTTEKSRQGSTDEEALKRLDIPELNDLLAIRKLKKIRDTYLEQFIREQVDGYIHPVFNLHLVRTFRSSSDSPNFQNIPKRDEEAMRICRRALFPRPGHGLMEIDFSGAEVRIAACYHKDPKLIHDVIEGDMHGDMAAEIFKIKINRSIPAHDKILRQAAKNSFVFPQFYGDYYKNNAIGICEWVKLPHTKWESGMGIELPKGHISDHLIAKGIKEFGENKKIDGKWVTTGFLKHMKDIENQFWGERYKIYAKWKDDWYAAYKEKGYIDMYTGFRCSGIMSKNDVTNYPVQGPAFHCLLWSFIEMDALIYGKKLDSKLIGQIHDSMVIDYNKDEVEYIVETAKRIITKDLPAAWPWIIVPIEAEVEICDIDEPWSEKHKYC